MQHIALRHAAGVDDLGLVHHAHGEAGQIVVLGGHHAGVLGGLTADEGAAGLAHSPPPRRRRWLRTFSGHVLAAWRCNPGKTGASRRSRSRR